MNGDQPLLQQISELLRAARRLYTDGGPAATLALAVDRLEEPLRVAIAGRVKAGKSTLLNALVGQDLAATDAGECTRIVTWYRDGITYQLMLHPRSGPARQVPFARSGPATAIDLDGLAPEDVDRLVVDWPSPALRDMTLIDTPGMGSMSTGLSEHTESLLAPEGDGASTADAVIYLMRHMHSFDVRFLEAFHDEPAQRWPMNTIGVLARADEVGHARLDALSAAHRIAARYRDDHRVRRLCQTVIPVAGLLAASGASLRQAEYRSLEILAAGGQEAQRLLVSADRFVNEATSLEVLPAERALLLERFGMYGVRVGIDLIRTGQVTSATDLSRQFLRYSGLDELRQLLANRFAARAGVLKARSALLTLEQVVREFPHPEGEALLRDLEQFRAGAHEFAEVELSDRLRTGHVSVGADGSAERAERLLGAEGIDDRSRLGLPPGASESEVMAAVREALSSWQRRSEDPTAPREHREAARVLVRTCEGILVRHLDGQSEAVAPAVPSPTSSAQPDQHRVEAARAPVAE
ncbi:MAG: GTPase [Pseudonocardiaceae bacterium]|nr:GTPase [Pseudonocardiaceae bacterium]